MPKRFAPPTPAMLARCTLDLVCKARNRRRKVMWVRRILGAAATLPVPELSFGQR